MKDNKMLKFGDNLVGLVKNTDSTFDKMDQNPNDEKLMACHPFDEVSAWIKSNDLENIAGYIDVTTIKTLKDLKLHSEEIMKNALSDNVIKDFEEAKKIRIIFNEIDPTKSARKKKPILYLHFVESKAVIHLDGQKLVYKLGKSSVINDQIPMKLDNSHR